MKRTACGCEIDDQTPHGGWGGASVPESDRASAGTDAEPGSRRGACLCDLAVGAHARIDVVEVPEQPALERRLADLGLVPGAEVDVLRRAPLGDPVVYRVCDYELCLRRAQAARVRILTTTTNTAGAVAADAA
ncbi:MAG: FeoA family protein [Pseudoclavibacter sp.]|jgi:ferrous iron transport protein A